MSNLQSTTEYFLGEGKANLQECIRLSFSRALHAGVRTIIIFTVNGDGIEIACKEFLNDPQYHNQRVIGVSFPFGAIDPSVLALSEERSALFGKFGIPLLRAASPIDDLPTPNRPVSIVRKTLEIFSGGTALCVWGILVASDAGLVPFGEHVIGCCADTAILAKATPTAQFLSSFAVREIICKPLIHDLSKGESLPEEINMEVLVKNKTTSKEIADQPRLVAAPEPQSKTPIA